MRRWIGVVAAMLLLCGCTQREEFETVMDVLEVQEYPLPRAISVDLPGETSLPVMESDNGRAYLCNDYEIYIQTLPGGDVDATMEAMTGFERESLTVLSTMAEEIQRYEFVWASAGEGGDFLGRGIILDDGNYHYTMSVLRNVETEQTSAVVWDGVFSSFRLV